MRVTPALLVVIILSGADHDSFRGHPGLQAHAAVRPVTVVRIDTVRMGDLLADAESRMGAVEIEGLAMESLYRSDVAPLVRDLIQLKDDPAHARRIALALVREGRRADIDPRLLLAVMTVENPWLDLGALSPAGAVGLMQVMPFHAGGWGCEGGDLTDLDMNICHGTKILANAIKRYDGDLVRALLHYNGCVLAKNTTDCHLYPSWVFRYTGSGSATDS
jgi:hypothetical protein